MDLKVCLIEENLFLIKPQCSFSQDVNTQCVNTQIKQIKEFIDQNDCENLVLDLSGLNVIYAAQIGILTGTYHFIKYYEGLVNIIVDSKEAVKSLQLLNLSNAEISLSSQEEKVLSIA